MINTFNLVLYFNGYDRAYYNISRVAVKRFIEWHKENEDFFGYDLDDHVSLTTH